MNRCLVEGFCLDFSIESYEISHTHSNEFLKSSTIMRTKYEESRERIEANREVSDETTHRYSISIFFSHVSMNIENGRKATIDVILYRPFVHNTVQKQ